MKWDTAPDWIPVSSARMNSLRLEPHIFDERYLFYFIIY